MSTTTDFQIRVSRASRSRLQEVDWTNLELGASVSDHMFVCDFADGRWQAPEIAPFGPFTLSPTTLALHYGQTIFEGMKAFRTVDGRVHIFRPDRHYDRLVRTTARMCMPAPPEELFMEGLRRLVALDKDWVPARPGTALYLRPMMFATGTKLTVRVSDNYKLAIICLPAGAYFGKPLRVKVERHFVRAVRGGTGFAKCGGNYGGAFYPTQQAREEGYDQVIWTDGVRHHFIEEMGMMNIFCVIAGVLVTPPLGDTLLDGVTRDSLLALARDGGLKVEERAISVDELRNGLEKGIVTEAFGAGTAAVVAPIREIGIDSKDYALQVVGELESGTAQARVARDGGDSAGLTIGAASGPSVAIWLKHQLEAIRYGRKPDKYGWNDYIS
ncbi:MAG TPA: branched-chain amino acid aminotransferase [Puia sp.]|nr:branched-chain amino acid aminotransferase [Puia sp.]